MTASLARVSGILCLASSAATAFAQGAPAWRVEGGQAGAHLGGSLATADVNGDGFADLVVGAPDHDGARTDEGRVLVFLGSSGGLAATPDWERAGGQGGAHFGAQVANAGDVNGDGFEDVVIGAPGWDVPANPLNPLRAGPPGHGYTTDEGRVFLFLGSSTGLQSVPSSAVAGIERGERFGSAVAGAGDVNGDGFDDVLVGATGKADGRGGVFLFDGAANGVLALPSWIQVGSAPGVGWGSLIRAVGDANGDGFDDFVAARPEQPTCGRLVLVHGSAAGPAAPALVNEAVAALGPAGDFDEDGHVELLFASDGCNGATLRWRGLDTGGAGNLPSFGSPAAVAAADLNGDGLVDIVGSAPDFALGLFHGRVLVYLNRPGATLDSLGIPAAVFDGDQDGAGWGEALATGDVDGDGSAELFIAAPRQDGAALDEGAVTLIPGWKQRTLLTQAAPAAGIAHDFRNRAVGGIGDFDGDGRSDMLVFADDQFELRYGTPAGLPEAFDALLVPPPLPPHDFLDVDFSTGDLNGDGFDDAQFTMLPECPFCQHDYRHSLYFGSAAGLSASPALTLLGPNSSGQEAEILGDVNADGFDDLLVGNALYFGTSGLPVFAQDIGGTTSYASFGRHRGVLSGDLDGDPYADVVVARQGLYLVLDVLRGSPQGLVRQQSFEPLHVLGDQSPFMTFDLITRLLALEDFDGDGRDDLLMEYEASGSVDTPGHELALFHGSPAGLERVTPWWDYTFLPPSWVQPVVQVLDADQDGFADVLFAGNRLHRGSPAGLLRTPTWVGAPTPDFERNDANQVGDFDGDGRPEFANNLPNGFFTLAMRIWEFDVP